MPVDLRNIGDSREMIALNSVLNKVSTVMLDYVSRAADETEALKRAAEITQKFICFFGAEAHECPDGTIWDPETKTCV